ncbi:unnamed protein product [Effrenium voratum]|uniref:Uncharacterized protein n=1 Tax=Effrenium voratum TaxID=2562239 RepID=A0AA36IGG6_9DINO|nr:unnamed protein product [Effrenium voratum]CAJ1387329.1 unnamed protein product [Effrenium voratum]CAJ1424796.1 unnamed protein product [Effrenium voratum]
MPRRCLRCHEPHWRLSESKQSGRQQACVCGAKVHGASRSVAIVFCRQEGVGDGERKSAMPQPTRCALLCAGIQGEDCRMRNVGMFAQGFLYTLRLKLLGLLENEAKT